jgi:hypothetical protein
MRIHWNSRWCREDGQSLLETAILTPFLLSIAFNAINIAYFWFMVLVLSTAPRQGVEYSSQGGAALTTTTSPSSSAVKDVVYDNLTHTINGTVSNASVQVCSVANGVDTTSHKANCTTYGPSFAFPSPDADPEAPVFVLHRVDVAYQVSPLIPGAAFHVLLPANMTFHRQVSMRSLY